MKITRTLTTYEIRVIGRQEVEIDGEVYEKKVAVNSVEILAASLNKTEARKALKDAGIDCPRNTEIDWVAKKETKYACELADFLAIAQPIA